MPSASAIDRFESQIAWSRIRSPTDCWPWKGPCDEKGYAIFQSDRKTFRADRFSYELKYRRLKPGKVLVHSCDIKVCVNPQHIVIHKPEPSPPLIVDAERPRAAFTAEDVAEIRARYAAGGITQEELAWVYEAHTGTIHKIIHRRTWKNVP